MGTPGHPALANHIEVFQERYFLWALKDAERETTGNFPFLSAIPQRAIKAFLDFASSLSTAERVSLMRARVINAHSISRKLNYEPTQNETFLLKSSFEHVRNQIWNANSWFAGFPLKVSKKEFRAVLRRSLDDAMIGDYEPWDCPNEWRYISVKGPFKVYTHVDVGGPDRQLWYYHSVRLDEKPLYEFVSLTTWLGLGPTYFDFVSRDGMCEAADTLRQTCRHFISALPDLLP